MPAPVIILDQLPVVGAIIDPYFVRLGYENWERDYSKTHKTA